MLTVSSGTLVKRT
jgi:hypothetical protein